jgi:hypothetical protein
MGQCSGHKKGYNRFGANLPLKIQAAQRTRLYRARPEEPTPWGYAVNTSAVIKNVACFHVTLAHQSMSSFSSGSKIYISLGIYPLLGAAIA